MPGKVLEVCIWAWKKRCLGLQNDKMSTLKRNLQMPGILYCLSSRKPVSFARFPLLKGYYIMIHALKSNIIGLVVCVAGGTSTL